VVVRGRFGGTGRGMPRVVKLEIRDRLWAGQRWREVAAAVGVHEGTISRVLNEFGGMPPRWTERAPSRLSVVQREEISLGLQAGKSYAEIGRVVGCHRSTVKREVDRVTDNGARPYRAWRADQLAYERARRPKPSKLMSLPRLRAEVEAGLTKRWSPRQIADRLEIDFPEDAEMRVSPETIYQSIFVQAKGGFRKDIAVCLRSGRARRRPRSRTAKTGQIRDMVMISERPAEIEDRAVPGHW